jgi:patatin-like phospholipase/acyl hydrolase
VSDLKKKKIALFNYGGGMRGLIPAHIMSEIEHRTGLRMAEMVDIFCGPSTGAILNGALTLRHPDNPDQPKYRARHMVKFYEREGLRIFPPDRFRSFRGLIHDFNNRMMKISQLNAIFRHGHYDPANLGRALKALYGASKLGDSLQSLIIPAYNIDGEQLIAITEGGETDDSPAHTQNNVMDRGGHAIWMKNMLSGRNRHKPQNVSLYNAIMASCAAPTFFPCHYFTMRKQEEDIARTYSCIDGSIFDNPCISYHGAIRQHLEDDEELVMLCLGTGQTNRSIKKEDWNKYGSLGYVDPVNDLPLINIFFHAPESALIEGFADEMNGNFYNFNKSLIYGREDKDWPALEIDNGHPDNLKKMHNFAMEVIEENHKEFDKVCHLLVSNRDIKKSQGKSLFSGFKELIRTKRIANTG